MDDSQALDITLRECVAYRGVAPASDAGGYVRSVCFAMEAIKMYDEHIKLTESAERTHLRLLPLLLVLPRDSGRARGEGIFSSDEPRDLTLRKISLSGLGMCKVLSEIAAGAR